jgi:hypothetical protein
MKKETDMNRRKRIGAAVLSVSVLATSVAVAADSPERSRPNRAR